MKLLSVNRVILILIGGEFLVTVFSGLVVPIFSVFIVSDIRGGTVEAVGFALAIYWIVKSAMQIPIGRWLDRHDGELDDYWAMIIGSTCSAFGAIFFFLFAHEIWHVYILEVFLGIADALIVPPFYALFSRHLDHGHEGLEWALRSSLSFGAGSALGGALGGIIGGAFGLRAVFLFTGIGALSGVIALLFLRPYIRTRSSAPRGTIIVEPRRV